MIENELLLLGLLKERPRHGYEIKLRIKQFLSLFAGLNPKSIYYPLSILEKKGLVEKRAGKQGRRPQRLVYSLTKKGHARFQELLTHSLLDFKRPQFSLDLSLYFLNYIPPAVASRRLRGRIFIVHKLQKEMQAMLKAEPQGLPAALCRILEHNLKMLEAEGRFLEDLLKAL
jgi:DNA-binding PadR family transcriptional regulator